MSHQTRYKSFSCWFFFHFFISHWFCYRMFRLRRTDTVTPPLPKYASRYAALRKPSHALRKTPPGGTPTQPQPPHKKHPSPCTKPRKKSSFLPLHRREDKKEEEIKKNRRIFLSRPRWGGEKTENISNHCLPVLAAAGCNNRREKKGENWRVEGGPG